MEKPKLNSSDFLAGRPDPRFPLPRLGGRPDPRFLPLFLALASACASSAPSAAANGESPTPAPAKSVSASAPAAETPPPPTGIVEAALAPPATKTAGGFTFRFRPGVVANGALVLVEASGPAVAGARAGFAGLKFDSLPAREIGQPDGSPSSAGMRRFLVAVPFDTKTGPQALRLLSDDGKTLAETTIDVKDGEYPVEKLKVDPKHVNPPKNAIKRIMREQKEIGAIYRVTTPKQYWTGSFQLPISSAITSLFGNKRMYNGEMRSFHPGLDLRAKIGTPIDAPEGGKVVLAKELWFTGNTVMLDHGFGLYTLYAHMSKLEVKVGDVVAKGGRLGLSGMTGRASGPHLHWGAVLQRQKFNPFDLTRVLD